MCWYIVTLRYIILYVVGYESRCLGVCTIYNRVRMFIVLPWNGVKLELSVGMHFYSPYLYKYDVPV